MPMIKDKLNTTELFRGLTSDQLTEISRLAVPCQFAQDERIFEQDQYAEYLYIVLKGEVQIRYKPYDGEVLTVSKVGEDQVFGWSSVLGRSIYTSAAVCTAPAECIRIRGRDILSLCETRPETGIIIMERLAAVIAERLSQTNEQIFKLLTHQLEKPLDGSNRRTNGTNHA
jgi:CRP/FNR family transcriptional regulator, cyclic AMP receptor protein